MITVFYSAYFRGRTAEGRDIKNIVGSVALATQFSLHFHRCRQAQAQAPKETMVEAVVSFVVQRVRRLIVQEAKFLYRVDNQIESVQTKLQLIQGFLKDTNIRQRDDATVRVVVAKSG
ncbi:hypothetical protein Prudu_001967 [Prunus dulcis]|uniref:Disease resistance N-terminal domain-containing protein n=1 Tax=Prunus dulcis TaxID=3755 RepID=A0A4Y1QPV4_PRUDU|nr:hypothetical protein Prudu_001967 [Prunus dulcis]